jgi:hypothetical protein
MGVAAPFSAVGDFFDAIERIHHEHGIAGLREPFAHLAERGPQPEDVRPHEHGGRRAARRVHEVGVAGAVRRGHRHIRFGHGDRIRDPRQHHGDARSHDHAELPARHQSTRLVFLSIPLKMILITHVTLLLEWAHQTHR